MSEKQNKLTSTLASVPLSILGVLFVHLVYGLTNLIISLVFLGISYVPVLKLIVKLILLAGDNTPDMFAMFFATMVAYHIFVAAVERIIKKVETRKLTLILTGIFLTVSNVFFVIINLIYRDPILGNALLSISGIAIFCKGRNI